MGNEHSLPYSLLNETEREEYAREGNHLPALHVAAFKGERDRILSDLGLKNRDPNKKSKLQRTALHYACVRGHESVISLFLDRDVSLNVRDCDGKTPLAMVVERRHHRCMELLLSKGASVNLHDNRQKTPLHNAAAGGDVRSIEILLGNGARNDVKDENGFSPSDLAKAGKHQECYERLTAQEEVEETKNERPSSPPFVVLQTPQEVEYVQGIAEQARKRRQQADRRLKERRRELATTENQLRGEIRSSEQTVEEEETRVKLAKENAEMKQRQLDKRLELEQQRMAFEEELESQARQWENKLEGELLAQAARFGEEMKKQAQREEESRAGWEQEKAAELERKRVEMEEERAVGVRRLNEEYDKVEEMRRTATKEQKAWRVRWEKDRRTEKEVWDEERKAGMGRIDRQSRELEMRKEALDEKFREVAERMESRHAERLAEVDRREAELREVFERREATLMSAIDEERKRLAEERRRMEADVAERAEEEAGEVKQRLGEEWRRVKELEHHVEKKRAAGEAKEAKVRAELDAIREGMRRQFEREREAANGKMGEERSKWAERERKFCASLEKERYGHALMRDRVSQLEVDLEREGRRVGEMDERARMQVTELRRKVDELKQVLEDERVERQEEVRRKDDDYATREREWIMEQQRKMDETKRRELEILKRRKELDGERRNLEESYYDNWVQRRNILEVEVGFEQQQANKKKERLETALGEKIETMEHWMMQIEAQIARANEEGRRKHELAEIKTELAKSLSDMSKEFRQKEEKPVEVRIDLAPIQEKMDAMNQRLESEHDRLEEMVRQALATKQSPSPEKAMPRTSTPHAGRIPDSGFSSSLAKRMESSDSEDDVAIVAGDSAVERKEVVSPSPSVNSEEMELRRSESIDIVDCSRKRGRSLETSVGEKVALPQDRHSTPTVDQLSSSPRLSVNKRLRHGLPPLLDSSRSRFGTLSSVGRPSTGRLVAPQASSRPQLFETSLSPSVREVASSDKSLRPSSGTPSSGKLDELADKKFEVQKLRFRLNQEKEKRKTTEQLLEGTRQHLDHTQNQLVSQCLARDSVTRDKRKLEEGLTAVTQQINKSADALLLLQSNVITALDHSSEQT
eukprot:m.162474 g.162474  ORF g.162474 m.162474 type:complete len:1102 (+) comp38843_c0_seq3:78-3383(+)